MARPKDADPERTRATILDAAEEEFAHHGFHGTRMVAIAERASVTHGLLYYYFDSKQRLYDRVVGRLFGRHLALVQALLVSRDDISVRELVVQSFDLFWEYPNQVRIMLWEMASGDDRAERSMQPFYETLANALPGLNNDSVAGRCHGHDPRDVYTTLLGALVVYFFRDPSLKKLFGKDRFTEADRARRRAHIGALVDLFF